MKKFLLLAFALFFISLSHATTDTVKVSNNQFTPATVNAVVGDTIVWVWVQGFHTTTSLEVPTGANAWDTSLTSAGASYTYPLTKAGTYKYDCTIHAPAMNGTLNVTEILPVTLSAFYVMPAGKNANIQWRTANELNVDYYNIKRSSDGTNFTDIGQVKAANKTGSNTYNFTDNSIAITDKYVYYYLQTVDKDGSKTSSAIQSFKNVFAKVGLLHNVSPNPIIGTDHLMLQFYADKSGQLLVQLFDSKGALVKQAQMTAVEGLNNGHFHTGALPAGTYVLQCTMDGKKETRQIVVQ
jgi:plastocyanin